VFGACALLPLGGLALLWRDTSDARRYTLHMVGATLAGPILLLCWAGSLDLHTGPRLPNPPSLDARQLFDGAADVQDADMRNAGIALLRSARFADGSELRLTRFFDADAAERYLHMLTQAMPAEPFTDGGRQGWRVVAAGVGSTLVVIEQHGPDLLELRARDHASGLARLKQQQVPVPQRHVSPAGAEPTAWWLGFAAMSIAHSVVFTVFALFLVSRRQQELRRRF
jgi:hypothetical protein